MPCAPNFSHILATYSTSGLLPPRALRRVAILLTFTLKRVIFFAMSEILRIFAANLRKVFQIEKYRDRKFL